MTGSSSRAASTIIHWPQQGEWTYEDYARLPDDGRRYEVIGGYLYVSPAPRPNHQQIIVQLAHALTAFANQNRAGQIYVAPIDVILPGLASPVQPDILFIAGERLDIVKENLIEGAPDLIVEVLSPGNPDYVRRTKYELYAEAQVKEYWIVDPESCTVDVFALRGSLYVPFGHFGPGGVIQSELLSELHIPLDDVCRATAGAQEQS